ncbi:hypothetical protein PA25_35900 [Pseudoalteromonas sp. A25]|uniref:hypothetical protein n=1 Tax=Pseudoalteromonas sp. A25 TaxID=116092 RepID=UPI00126135D2|nr:hypothetical protein [Pseudoalteromonas sp. A25]BBN83605.1 hypothetical protein PA25_35900 [Pseudoalteromonas sp. A25]
MSNQEIKKQEMEEKYSYLASLYEMYVNGGIDKMTDVGLNKYIEDYCPFMPEKLQNMLQDMPIGGQFDQSQLTELLKSAEEQMLDNPITW